MTYEKLEEVFDIVDSLLPKEVKKEFPGEEGEVIDREIALLHHLVDGLLIRIERLDPPYENVDG
jgi:hypothetical protein